MQIHHLNCGTMRAYGFPLDDGTGGFFKRGHGVIHCLLVDTGAGLVLVDTGWGTRDYTNPSPAVRQFTSFVGCPCDLNETAIRQVQILGYDPAEVTHILVTHMHLDHAGGLPDFPAASTAAGPSFTHLILFHGLPPFSTANTCSTTFRAPSSSQTSGSPQPAITPNDSHTAVSHPTPLRFIHPY